MYAIVYICDCSILFIINVFRSLLLYASFALLYYNIFCYDSLNTYITKIIN